MIPEILDWLTGKPGWHKRHREAWAHAAIPDATGITPFQRDCETALVAALRAKGSDLANRRLERGPSEYADIYAEVRGTSVQVWITADGASVLGDTRAEHFEEWDGLTPQDLTQTVVESVLAAVDHSETP